MSAGYAKAVRQALPHARVAVDHFHVVKLANQMIDDVRRRTTQALRGRRGRSCDRSGPATGGCSAGRNGSPIPSGEDVHKLDTFDADGDLVAAWITKNCSAM